jgi:hypothetical protein
MSAKTNSAKIKGLDIGLRQAERLWQLKHRRRGLLPGLDGHGPLLRRAKAHGVSVENGRHICPGGLVVETDGHQRHLEDELQPGL